MSAKAQIAKDVIDFNSDYVMTIDGESVTSDESSPVYNPANKRVFAEVPVATESHLNNAIAAARRSFGTWRNTA